MRYLTFCLLTALQFSLAAPLAFATSDLFSTRDSRGGIIFCDRVNGLFAAGQLETRNGATVFIPTSSKLSPLKKKYYAARRAVPQDRARVRRLSRAVKSLAARISENNIICAREGGDPVPLPNPTPTPSQGSFDKNGNTTRFGIPSGFVGNISRGKTAHSEMCVGCHVERTNYTYTTINQKLNSVSAMIGINPSTQELSDITAYLNRFQQ
jgi:hypothetical protein